VFRTIVIARDAAQPRTRMAASAALSYRKRVSRSTVATASTDAAKIGINPHIIAIATINGRGHDARTFGGTPLFRFGRLIHHDVTPVMLSQTSDNAKAVFSQRLTYPKSP